MGGHLRYQNETILAVQNLHATSMPSIEFPSVRLTVRKQITIKRFQDGRHGYYHRYDSDADVENAKIYGRDILMRNGP